MRIFNKKLDNRLIYLLVCIALFSLFLFMKKYIATDEAFKEQASLNLAHLGVEIEDLNKSLDKITNSDSKLSEFKDEDYISWPTLHSIYMSTGGIKKITGKKDLNSLEYFYMDTYYQINGILKDKIVDEKEKRYLEELREFTSEVLVIYSECIHGGDILQKDDYFLADNLSSNQVYDIYTSYFDKTYELYMQDKYKYMRTYKEYKPSSSGN